MRDTHGVIIDEAYRNFTPHVNAQRAVDRLLAGIPQQYLSGLSSVVLTDTGSLNHRRKRQKTLFRKRKVAIREARGLYHQTWNNEPAWIEILVDNATEHWPSWLLRVPFFRDIAFAEVLFHEVGHHIHYTQAPEFKDREAIAEKWAVRLTFHFLKRKCWYRAALSD